MNGGRKEVGEGADPEEVEALGGFPKMTGGGGGTLEGWAEILSQVGVGDRKQKYDSYVNMTFFKAQAGAWEHSGDREKKKNLSTSKENT